MNTPFQDDPINPVYITKMDSELFDKMLTELRERRTAIRERVAKTIVVPSSEVSHFTADKYKKLVDSVKKKLDKIDKDIDKVTEEVNKLRLASIEVS